MSAINYNITNDGTATIISLTFVFVTPSQTQLVADFSNIKSGEPTDFSGSTYTVSGLNFTPLQVLSFSVNYTSGETGIYNGSVSVTGTSASGEDTQLIPTEITVTGTDCLATDICVVEATETRIYYNVAWYPIVITQPNQNYYIDLTGSDPDLDVWIFLYDSNGDYVDDRDSDLLDKLFVSNLDPGTYYVGVAVWDAPDYYGQIDYYDDQFRVYSSVPLPTDCSIILDVCPPTPLPFETLVYCTETCVPGASNFLNNVAWYTFTITESKEVSVNPTEVNTSESYTIILFDSNGINIDYEYNGGFITSEISAGTYYIGVASGFSYASNMYQMTGDGPLSDCFIKLKVCDPTSYTGYTISNTSYVQIGQLYPDSTYYSLNTTINQYYNLTWTTTYEGQQIIVSWTGPTGRHFGTNTVSNYGYEVNFMTQTTSKLAYFSYPVFGACAKREGSDWVIYAISRRNFGLDKEFLIKHNLTTDVQTVINEYSIATLDTEEFVLYTSQNQFLPVFFNESGTEGVGRYFVYYGLNYEIGSTVLSLYDTTVGYTGWENPNANLITTRVLVGSGPGLPDWPGSQTNTYSLSRTGYSILSVEYDGNIRTELRLYQNCTGTEVLVEREPSPGLIDVVSKNESSSYVLKQSPGDFVIGDSDAHGANGSFSLSGSFTWNYSLPRIQISSWTPAEHNASFMFDVISASASGTVTISYNRSSFSYFNNILKQTIPGGEGSGTNSGSGLTPGSGVGWPLYIMPNPNNTSSIYNIFVYRATQRGARYVSVGRSLSTASTFNLGYPALFPYAPIAIESTTPVYYLDSNDEITYASWSTATGQTNPTIFLAPTTIRI